MLQVSLTTPTMMPRLPAMLQPTRALPPNSSPTISDIVSAQLNHGGSKLSNPRTPYLRALGPMLATETSLRRPLIEAAIPLPNSSGQTQSINDHGEVVDPNSPTVLLLPQEMKAARASLR